MKKILFIGALFLSGCAGGQQAQINSAMQMAQQDIGQQCQILLSVSEKEVRAWGKSKDETNVCNANYAEPYPREKMMEISHCAISAMTSIVRPESHSQEKFDAYIQASQKAHTQYANGEISWDDIILLSNERWEQYFDGANKGSYFNYAKCHNAVINQTIMPVYPVQLRPALLTYLNDVTKLSRQADKEDMAQEDYQIAYEELWADFIGKEQRQVSQINAEKEKAWQDYSRRLGELSVQITEAEARARGKRVQCTQLGNTVNCASW